MIYREQRPGPALAPFVSTLWYCEGYRGLHACEKVLPSGCVQIVINLAGENLTNFAWCAGKLEKVFRQPALVGGVQTRALLIDTQDLRRLFGIVFRPGGAPAILGLPAHELSEREVDFAEDTLRDRLLGARETEELFGIAETWLRSRIGRGLAGHPAVDWAVRHIELPLAELVRQTGLSERRFREVFRAQVGVAPKLYQRIRRFRRVLLQAEELGERDWAQLALDCGYFDQAHLIHDFQAFSGIAPTEYAQRRLSWATHISADSYNSSGRVAGMLEEL